MKGLGEAVNAAAEQLGHMPTSAEELIGVLEGMENTFGISDAAWTNLNNIINTETFPTILKFTDSMGEAAAAALYYAD
jgi:hypothetical protein